MKYATVCSGIGAPEVAWRELWGQPVFTSEIEAFPSAVLKHHMPDVPNYGDMTKYKEWPDHELELICGGTPCQSFSVAGLRKGMDDPRGNLTLTFLGILARYNPRWFIWENVPGVFSSRSNGQSDFGGFLSALAELGYSLAYRVFDAAFFGVAQRRRRVFLVGHFGNDWRPPYAVLFEPQGVRACAGGIDVPHHIWHIVTCENQKQADERIPHLLNIPGKRGIIIEPMLEEITLNEIWAKMPSDDGVIHQVILGPENGKGKRPFAPAWAESVRAQCEAAGVPFYRKDTGEGVLAWR